MIAIVGRAITIQEQNRKEAMNQCTQKMKKKKRLRKTTIAIAKLE